MVHWGADFCAVLFADTGDCAVNRVRNGTAQKEDMRGGYCHRRGKSDAALRAGREDQCASATFCCSAWELIAEGRLRMALSVCCIALLQPAFEPEDDKRLHLDALSIPDRAKRTKDFGISEPQLQSQQTIRYFIRGLKMRVLLLR